MPSWTALSELVDGIHARPAAAKKFALPGADLSDRSNLMIHEIAMIPLVLAERSFRSGSLLKLARLEKLYIDQEPYIVSPDPRIDLVIPILGASFRRPPKCDQYSIVRVSAKIHRAASGMQQLSRRDKALIGSATHALVVEDVPCIPGGYGPFFDNALNESEDRAIQRFFQAAAIALPGHATFAQIVFVPRGWSPYALDDAKQPHISLLRDYGMRLDRVDSSHAFEVSPPLTREIYALASALDRAHPSAKVAARRLVHSYEQDDDEDRIVDLSIGLEALLGSGFSETVHRISMRAAALLAMEWKEDSKVLYDAMKDMYSFRSRVVHGTPGPHKKDLLQIAGTPIHASRFALAALSSLLRLAVTDDSFDPAKLDDKYIFPALNANAGTKKRAD
jgi:hypothetical protein